ncbi:hypothetical protein SAMN05216483_6772 [Streptomyces sp. 2131.1]|uniref:DUF6082 family protein n=1 Tax=Streptomyces sp. 2131.1 TaxID=1855346 RepID=UPI0008942410|nr:DUF6082 family protein [Streptomyces sp. 2131.1]SEE84767.1 hypothetical protein SAMN05216483_6772 [Streptomyces sp. 2131.1]
MKFERVALLALTALAGACLVQRDRHHRQLLDVATADRQERAMDRIMANPELAEAWKPDDMSATKYVTLMSANLALGTHSLRHRLGVDSTPQMRFYADLLMRTKCVRDYWQRFGSVRESEAVHGERHLGTVNDALTVAYRSVQREQKDSSAMAS